MFQFVETFKIEKQQTPYLDWHQSRINKTFAQYYKGYQPFIIADILKSYKLPEKLSKARLKYSSSAFDFSIQTYHPKEIESIQLVEVKNAHYPFKSLDRSLFNHALQTVQTDEVLLCENNKILDLSYANVALQRNNQWFTPSTFLLNGTCRQRLLQEKLIKATEVTKDNIFSFDFISPINALLDLGEIKIKIEREQTVFL